MGILKDKTILYVTHQVEFLPAADLILVHIPYMLPTVLQIKSLVFLIEFNYLLECPHDIF